MKREDVQAEYLWDLSDLYADDAAWELDFKAVKVDAEQFKTFKGKLTQSPEMLVESLKLREKISRLMDNIVTYARQKLDENTKNATYQGLVARAETLMAEIGDMMSFAIPELLSQDYDQIGRASCRERV